jgi:phosphoglycolate phosphatase
MKKLDNIDLLVFDFDGTLLDSKEDVAASVNSTLKKFDLGMIDPDKIWSFLGDGAGYLIDRAFAYFSKNTPPEATDIFLKDYEENSLKKTSLYPGVFQMLESLNDFKTAIFTNKRHDFTVRICEGLGIVGKFDYILGRNSHFPKKPEPDGLYIIMERLGIKAQNTAMIGDTTIDIITGKKAGTKTVAVTWGVHTKNMLIKENPDLIVEKIGEIPSVFL